MRGYNPFFNPEKEGSMKRNFYVGAIFLVLLGTLIAASVVLEKRAAVEAAGVMAPRFEVDPLWPKPLRLRGRPIS